MSIIDHIDNIVTGFITNFNSQFPSAVIGVVNALRVLIIGYLTFWILYNGFQILWGRNNKSIKDFMWEAFLKGIFIILCFNGGGFLELTKEATIGLKDFAAGGVHKTNLFYTLQACYSNISTLTLIILKNGKLFSLLDNPLTTFFSVVFIWVALLIAIIPTIIIYVSNLVSFFILLAIMPLAFYFLIFGALKDIFRQWLEMIISNLLTILIFSVLVNPLLQQFYRTAYFYLSAVDSSEKTNPLIVGVSLILVAILVKLFIDIAMSISKSLTRVTIEAASHTALGNALGLGGSIAGLTTGAGAKVAKGHIKVARFGVLTAKQGFSASKKALDSFRKRGGGK